MQYVRSCISKYGESYKRYKSARAFAAAVINSTCFRTDGCYFLTTSLGDDDVVAILDTNGPVGPVSGRAIWRFEVQAHPWGQEVAEKVWGLSNGRRLPRTLKAAGPTTPAVVGGVK